MQPHPHTGGGATFPPRGLYGSRERCIPSYGDAKGGGEAAPGGIAGARGSSRRVIWLRAHRLLGTSRSGGVPDARPVVQHGVRRREPRGGGPEVVVGRVEAAAVGGFVDELERGGGVALAVGVAEVDAGGVEPVQPEGEVRRVRGRELLEAGELRRGEDGRAGFGRVHREVVGVGYVSMEEREGQVLAALDPA